MARMAALWSFTCVLPDEGPDHDEWDSTEEMEQPGTSYDSRSSASSGGKNKGSSRRASGEFETRGRSYHHHNNHHHHHRSAGNCYSGGAHMLACFRAGAINLIVHPALQMSTSTGAPHHRAGASTVQPVNSLPRASFLELGAAAENSGDEPTSPVVTCIGQVRKDKPRTPLPRKPVVAEAVVAAGDHLMRLKSTKREKPQLPRSPSSPAARPSKWRQILGGRGTSSVQQPPRDEFHVDLNRFSSVCASVAKTDVKMARRTPGTGAFLAKSLMMLQMERNGGGDEDDDDGKLANKASCRGAVISSEQASWHDGKPALAMVSKSGTSEEVLLWKRRSGAKPLMLDLKRLSD